jgi:hypothetical protein
VWAVWNNSYTASSSACLRLSTASSRTASTLCDSRLFMLTVNCVIHMRQNVRLHHCSVQQQMSTSQAHDGIPAVTARQHMRRINAADKDTIIIFLNSPYSACGNHMLSDTAKPF